MYQDELEHSGDSKVRRVNIEFEYAYDENFGVTDNLYSLGFTSLSLMKFNASISELFHH